MQILLQRIIQTDESCTGILYIDKLFECFTLEDITRPAKVPGSTAIPTGEYEIALRCVDSPMNQRYNKRFMTRHHGMLWLQDVPDFEYVYIHIGNSVDDTDGCILTGSHAGKNVIYDSTAAYHKLYNRCINALGQGDPLTIKIENVFR